VTPILRVSCLLALVGLLAGERARADSDRLARGRELYEQGCQSCHGGDGRGNPQWESAVRPIEFTDCGTTSEATEVWTTVVKKGGPSRGLDSAMPAFEGAYTDDEIGAIVAFIRSFCPQAERYPPGDLNFRRLLRTGKAFPEQELVLRASHRPEDATRETELEILYENRLGPTFQYELVLPLRTSTNVPGEGSGIGDLELEAKKVVYFSQSRLEILSLGLGLGLPTGSKDKGEDARARLRRLGRAVEAAQQARPRDRERGRAGSDPSSGRLMEARDVPALRRVGE
jgi:mono/diheme cytochrome c family protein